MFTCQHEETSTAEETSKEAVEREGPNQEHINELQQARCIVFSKAQLYHRSRMFHVSKYVCIQDAEALGI